MGRVEETDSALIELEKEVNKAIRQTTDKFIVLSDILTFQAGIYKEIAKNTAQLADDIHFIREAMAREIEGEESVAVKYVREAES